MNATQRLVTTGLAMMAFVTGLVGVAHAGPADIEQASGVTKLLAQRAANRMADQCRSTFCMDANEYGIGCIEPNPGARFTVCSYRIFGYYFRGDEPTGDFDCSRSTVTRSVGHQVRGHSVGKTRCRDDRQNKATYPWPRPGPCNDTYVIVAPAPSYQTASCAPPPPVPKKTLRAPLESRGFSVLIIDEF
jgi:hypothetical protein